MMKLPGQSWWITQGELVSKIRKRYQEILSLMNSQYFCGNAEYQ
jgi:hypothetical protein